jgi:hypothetical protein
MVDGDGICGVDKHTMVMKLKDLDSKDQVDVINSIAKCCQLQSR